VNKENCARPLRPRSRSTGGGLAALASKCGADSVMAGTVQGSPASLSEDEMQKIIGGERGSHLPDCVPADAAALEIRPDSLHGLFSDITKIGEGSSGSVYRAVRRSDGMAVAVKQVKPAHERDWMLYRYEVHVMKSHADQETLVSCFDAFRDEAHLYMVLELMSASVADVLERRRAGAFNRALALSTSVTRELQGPASSALLASIDGTSRIAARKKSKASGALAMATGFEEGLIAYVCREVLRGLQQVHHISRVHRDIKSDNVLVRPDGAVKVADFGFCAELQAGARNTVVGTPYQMAPEVIRGKDYGTPVDIWSTGVLAYEMAEGVPPHEGLPPIRAMFKIATSDPPALGDAWSPELRDFVASCCKLDPSGRPSAPDALDHPFISRACSRGDAGAIFAALCADDA
jgi:serine/threonine protein kinase